MYLLESNDLCFIHYENLYIYAIIRYMNLLFLLNLNYLNLTELLDKTGSQIRREITVQFTVDCIAYLE